MEQRASNAGPAQILLSYDLIYMVLTEYMDKHRDILNFARANRFCYRLYIITLYRHNVRHGGCSVLEWAARQGNMAVITRTLNVPRMEAFAPTEIWPKVLEIAQDTRNMELAKMLFQVETVRTRIKNAAARKATKVVHHMLGGPPLTYEAYLLQPMFEAAKKGQQDFIELYLSHGASIDLYDDKGRTVLYLATRNVHINLVKVLLEQHQAYSDCRSSFNRKPIEIAARTGSVKLVELLLSYGADPRFDGHATYSPAFIEAARHGHKNVVKLLLQDGRVDPDARNHQNQTALETAIERGRAETVRLLLDDGRVDPNSRDNDGMTPLLTAAKSRYLESPDIIDMLLSDERVDASARNNEGLNAWTVAARYGRMHNFKALLLCGKMDPNEGDVDVATPVMYAATTNTELLKLFIADKRVYLDMMDICGNTALYWAVRSCKLENARLLLSSGRVDSNRENYLTMTPLMRACFDGSVQMVKLLLDIGGVDLNKRHLCGSTALMLAVLAVGIRDPSMERIIKMILDTGHDLLNLQYSTGLTMLEHAVEDGAQGTVELLLSTDKVVVTRKAMELCNDEEIMELLIKYNDDWRWIRIFGMIL